MAALMETHIGIAVGQSPICSGIRLSESNQHSSGHISSLSGKQTVEECVGVVSICQFARHRRRATEKSPAHPG